MSIIPAEEDLPAPPASLSFGEVVLRFSHIAGGDPSRDFVPYYHFRIFDTNGQDTGHINFRVGETAHVRICAGHIGFGIGEAFRGRRFALQACHAIAPFVRFIYDTVTITCDPDNIPSRRTIEHLGALFMDEVAVPPEDPAWRRGARAKRRYRWTP